jgi:hypothetical protein
MLSNRTANVSYKNKTSKARHPNALFPKTTKFTRHNSGDVAIAISSLPQVLQVCLYRRRTYREPSHVSRAAIQLRIGDLVKFRQVDRHREGTAPGRSGWIRKQLG